MVDFEALVAAGRYSLAFPVLQNLLYTPEAGFERRRRGTVSEMLRKVSAQCLRGNSQRSIQEKLELLYFLLSCFSEAYDTEGQFIIYYETLMLRQTHCIRYPELSVSADEWMEFARECSRSSYHSNSIKAYDMAISTIDQTELRNQALAEQESALRSMRRTAAAHEVEIEIESEEKPVGSSQSLDGAAKYLSAIKKLNIQKLNNYASRQLPHAIAHQ